MEKTKASDLPTRFGFLLLRNFTLISLSSAVEPLRMANRICRKQLYHWKTISETGRRQAASDGLQVTADDSISSPEALSKLDALIVCGGIRVEEHVSAAVTKFLWAAQQRGVALGAVCTGSYALAKAGLLDGYRCSIHWENMAVLSDTFRKVQVRRSVYTIDRDRYTSSGGITPVDMMLYFIGAQCGPEVASGVAEQFIFDRIRQADDLQRIPLKHDIGNQSEKLVVAVELMEANIREPISQAELAAYAGLSRRQLQRLFQRYLACTPSHYYRKIRLRRARELLRQTGMNLVEISAMTGFVSTSHFSKSYKEHYGYSPSVERQ